MPTVEDYFDDETDIPLPSASSSKPRALGGQGLQGALLEEISTEDPDDDLGFDYSRMADQGRGIFGENSQAPPPDLSGNGKGKVAVRDSDAELRPAGGNANANQNTPMGGFMGDMMRMQQVEEERLEKLRKQFGSTTIAKDPSVYKE
jgi:signal recognition particle subunit SRP19